MRQWGANVVRLQIHPVADAKRFQKPLWDAWSMTLDTTVAHVRDAVAAGLWVVVDLHEAPIADVAQDHSAFWSRGDLASNFCRAWTDLVRRLEPYRAHIWGYDLYNEPLDRDELPGTPRQWSPLAEQIAHTIRTMDAVTWLVVESGPGYGFGGFKTMTPITDRRTVYEAHIYDPLHFVQQGLPGNAPAGSVHYPGVVDGTLWNAARIEQSVAPGVAFQARYHVPIFIGEFSVVRWAPHDDALRWLTDVLDIMERHQWSWAYHAFRECDCWNLEDDDNPKRPGDPPPKSAAQETDRARVIKAALAKNGPA